MSGNERAYLIGVSHIVVGISSVVTVTPMAGVQSGFLELHDAGTSGLLAFVNGTSFFGASGTVSGYQVRDNDKVELNGPAKFYLAASVNEVTAAYFMRLSAGATVG